MHWQSLFIKQWLGTFRKKCWITQDTPGQACKLANKEDGDVGRPRTRKILISNEAVTQGMMPSGFLVHASLHLLCLLWGHFQRGWLFDCMHKKNTNDMQIQPYALFAYRVNSSRIDCTCLLVRFFFSHKTNKKVTEFSPSSHQVLWFPPTV